MRVVLRILAVLILVLGLVGIVLTRDQLASTSPFAADILLIITAALLGFALGSRGRSSPPPDDGAMLALTTHQIETESTNQDTIEERALLSFARCLLGVTASDQFHRTVESQLPILLRGRKVWIQIDGKGQYPTVLGEEVQEWTTFPLRVDDLLLGLLGVESAGGLAPQLKLRIQSITPLIAQSLKTTQEVDVFREASVVDLLTGASTRREGLTRLQTESKRAQRTGSTMAVLMIDLDHFKAINDRHGHAVGDALLTAIGQTLTRTLRASDVRCRWGGEEFLIVLPDTTLSQAQVVATHLLQNVAATTVPSTNGPVSSTASIGLTISRPAEVDVNRIVARADMALYQAKNAGRACVRVVLGGFDGEPVGLEGPRKVATPTSDLLPFPDRRDPLRRDRRSVPGPGRRKTDPQPSASATSEPHGIIQERRSVNG